MTADEILKALEESEGFYLEVDNWYVARDGDEEDKWEAGIYRTSAEYASKKCDTFREALEYALKDGKP